MQPRVSDIYDTQRWGYDTATKVWSTVLGLVVAGVIDWCAVAMPVRNHPRNDPSLAGWTFALAIAMVAPASWLIGRLTKKDWDGGIMWSVVTAAAVVFQLVVLVWAGNFGH